MKTEPNEPSTGFGYATPYSSYYSNGLTKREYFAALAMQGILAGKIQTDDILVAEYAVMYADNLIESLNVPV
jgi:hypothetical protein